MVNTVRWRIFERPANLSETELGHWLRAQLGASTPSS
jgi:hypothetical protein